MSTAGTVATAGAPRTAAHADRLGRDSLIVVVGGQVERLLGILTVVALRWGLDPGRLGVYTGLRLFLDGTNRSSLGVGLGAVQQIPILRGQGDLARAQHVANVAHTANSLTCLIYALGLLGLAWWQPGGPLAREWSVGLAIVAGLTLLKRYESFLIAVLRAHGEFRITTELDIVESMVSALAVSLGLALAGFWGLMLAVGVILSAKIVYLHTRHPFRFGWAWDGALVAQLLRAGLPILANTAAFAAVVGLDRTLILTRMPDGERLAGLYTVALLGTGWSLDLAGRLVLVLYTHFQTMLGRTADPSAVARAAVNATEVQAPLLALGAAAVYVLAPGPLGWLFPRYADGLPALRPLLPGAVVLGLAWPARQMLIALGRPYRLLLATLAGLVLTGTLGLRATRSADLATLAGAMSLAYLGVFLLTGLAAFGDILGTRAWLSHLRRLVGSMVPFALAALLATQLPVPTDHPLTAWLARGMLLALLTLLPAWNTAERLGLLGRVRARRLARLRWRDS